MNRDLFNIAAVETEVKGLLHMHKKTAFVVEYRGVEINRFPTREAAEDCVEDAVSVRDDAQWAFEESLRSAGYNIPA